MSRIIDFFYHDFSFENLKYVENIINYVQI